MERVVRAGRRDSDTSPGDSLLLSLGRIEGQLGEVLRRLDSQDQRVLDHEARLRAVEGSVLPLASRDESERRLRELERFCAQARVFGPIAIVAVTVGGNWLVRHLGG